MGFGIVATAGTQKAFRSAGIPCNKIYKVGQGRPNSVDLIINEEIQLIVNTPLGKTSRYDEYNIGRVAMAHKVPCLTTLSAAWAAVNAIRDSQGFALTVTDEEILSAIPEVARGSNVFAEPAAAATYAGLKKAAKDGRVKDTESVVLLISGNGLKDVASVMKTAGKPFIIQPDMADLRKLISSDKLA